MIPINKVGSATGFERWRQFRERLKTAKEDMGDGTYRVDLTPEEARELDSLLTEIKGLKARLDPKIERRRVMSLPKGSPERYEALRQWEFNKLVDGTNVEFEDLGDEGAELSGPEEDLQRWKELMERWDRGPT
jgi:hypothetical protein